MKKLPRILGGMAASACAFAVVLPTSAAAQVSQDDFNTLKRMVEQLTEKVQKLEQTHDQDQKTHAHDEQAIQQLTQQLGETHQIATNAVQKAEAAAQAQPAHPVTAGPSATHNLVIAGDAEALFGRSQGQSSAFALADFAPIFLFRASDDILFEAGFDFTLANNAPTAAGTSYGFDVSFATIDYMMNDYVTLMAGNMLLPLGTYSERSAGWLNKFPDNPLPRGLLPGSGLGAQLRGALPVGQSGQMLTYSVYGANGPSSVDGTGNSGSLDLGGNVGILSTAPTLPRQYGYGLPGTTFSTMGNLHSNPSGGGRVAFFYPWKPHYDLELGVSGQSGEWNDLGDNWSAVVVDASLHISPYFEVKGEYINTWAGTTDLGTIRPNGWWVQAGYKFAGLNLDLPMVNNVELVGRYDYSNDGLSPSTKNDRYTAGFVYYFTNTLLLEGDYEWLNNRGPNANQFPNNEFLIQLSYGF
jgi:hypothetical protein